MDAQKWGGFAAKSIAASGAGENVTMSFLRERLNRAGVARMLAFGAIVGSFFDGFHTHSGTIAYARPVLWQMAWWVPALFAVAYALTGIGYVLANRSCGRPDWFGFVCFGALYWLSAYLPASSSVRLVVLSAGGIGIWAVRDRSPATLVFGMMAALLGPAFEITLVTLGAFSYRAPDVAGVGLWLPALYFASASGAGPLLAWIGFGRSAPATAQG
jgi:hypothetical protein